MRQSEFSNVMNSDTASKTFEQLKAEGYNTTDGNLNERDGYNCTFCRNKGKTLELEIRDGTEKAIFKECQCMHIRNSIMRMQRSGRADVIGKLTFQSFVVENEFQQKLKNAAQDYVKSGTGWFFMGGQPGCGKSHIGTAIFREFLLSGKSAQYMAWREDATRIKSLVTEADKYGREISLYKSADVLYIDDLFKTGRAIDGQPQRPSAADISLAFEILNSRYNHPKQITIISTESSIQELISIDEGIASRIAEKSKPYLFNISHDQSKNYRLRGIITL